MIRSSGGLHPTGKSKAQRRGDQGVRGSGPLPRRGIQRVPIPYSAIKRDTDSDRFFLAILSRLGELKEEKPEPYHLQWRSTPEAVVVASSGWGTGWVSLKNGQLLVIERSTLTSTVLPLHEETALR
jgi:hypothetical protein